MSKLPKTVLSRSLELLKLATKVGGEELLNRGDQAARQVQQAKLLVDSLGRLKGAAMKIGQLLSMDFSDLFPPEVRRVLEQLQSSSPHFMELREVESILARELPSRYSEISNLSHLPIAAASIGQVHSATWNGQEIVIKIQYPGVADSVDSDLALLKNVVQSLLTLTRKKMDIDPLFDEFSQVFKAETNYSLELENLQNYKGLMQSFPEYRCPKPFPELSTEKILTMSYEKGTPLREWMLSGPSLEKREQVGRSVLNLYTIEFFRNAFVQSDPNPANFLVDDKGCLVLLDYGAMKSFSKDFIRNYVSLMQFVVQKDMPATLYQAQKMNFISPEESPETEELFYNMLRASLCAFDADRQPFDFADKNYFENTKLTTRDFGKAAQFTPPPKDLIFLHRKLVGVFAFLRDLDLKIDLMPYWEKSLKLEA